MNTVALQHYRAVVEALLRAERKIVSGQFLDMVALLDPDFAERIRTVPNPNRVGIHDAYVAYL